MSSLHALDSEARIHEKDSLRRMITSLVRERDDALAVVRMYDSTNEVLAREKTDVPRGYLIEETPEP